jgi:hypothetical protein
MTCFSAADVPRRRIRRAARDWSATEADDWINSPIEATSRVLIRLSADGANQLAYIRRLNRECAPPKLIN